MCNTYKPSLDPFIPITLIKKNEVTNEFEVKYELAVPRSSITCIRQDGDTTLLFFAIGDETVRIGEDFNEFISRINNY